VNFEKANTLKTLLKNNASLSHSLTQVGKERGLTALYMGSDKKLFSNLLTNQRKITDKSLIALKQNLVTEGESYIPLLSDLLGEKTTLDKTNIQNCSPT
jgi:plasmid maintenance system antidote protein VapI